MRQDEGVREFLVAVLLGLLFAFVVGLMLVGPFDGVSDQELMPTTTTENWRVVHGS